MTTRPVRATSAPKTRKPLLSRVPPDFVRAVLKGHSSLGLAFAALIYLVCLTGSLSVFATEFIRWENPALPRLAAASPEAAQAAYDAALAKSGTTPEHIYVDLPGGDQTLLSVRVQKKGEEDMTAWVADARGRLVGVSEAPWTEFLTTLHINLHLPRSWGEFLVGLVGVALLSSLISGVLAHPRILRDAFHLRLGGSRRLQEADLHNRLGVWALPFHLTVSLTGALLGLTTLIVGVLGLAVFQGDTSKVYALFLAPEAKVDRRPAPALPILPFMKTVSRLDPTGRIERVVIDDADEAGTTIQVLVDDNSTRIANTNTYVFDRSGRLIHTRRAADFNLGETIRGALGQLHFGWFGGGIVKIAYGLLGLGLTYLAASGVTIWLARRRDKGRATPRWERVWTAFVWGQPAALAVSALAILLAPVGSTDWALAAWMAISIAAMICATIFTAPTLARSGRNASGILILATALAHALLRPNGDPIAWTVDIVLAAMGLALVAPALRSGAAHFGINWSKAGRRPESGRRRA